MSYYCTRCEADEHPNLTKTQVRDDLVQEIQHTTTAWCQNCNSNTVHITGGKDD